MSEWNPNMNEAPRETDVLVTFPDGSMYVEWAGDCSPGIAWMPLPEPFKPRKPEPIDTETLDGFLMGTERMASIDYIARVVEKRTREIVAWEQEHGE